MSSLCKHKKTCIGNEIINELKGKINAEKDYNKSYNSYNLKDKKFTVKENDKYSKNKSMVLKNGLALRYIKNNERTYKICKMAIEQNSHSLKFMKNQIEEFTILAIKKDGMVNIKSRTCLECKKIPVFNIEGEITALYCVTHKKDGMVNVKSKPCIHEGCKTLPVFNVYSEKKGLYCSVHKLDGMIDGKHKKCVNPGCAKSPTFNFEDEIPLYCGEPDHVTYEYACNMEPTWFVLPRPLL
jgi:hypothetical protein